MGLENAGLENDEQTFSNVSTITGSQKRMAKIGFKDAYLQDESVTDVAYGVC